MICEITRRKKIVLVIEDDPNMNRLICDVLNECGYATISALEWNGASGLLKRVNPDLFLIDFMLPDLNADKICGILMENEESKHVPVIVMSSVREFGSKFASPTSGVRSFLCKPFVIGELINEVNEAVGGAPDAAGRDEADAFYKNADDFLDSYMRKSMY
jgi:DNA-binding response OmpR family regulator